MNWKFWAKEAVSDTWTDKAKAAAIIPQKESTYFGGEYGNYDTGWDAEKNQGEMGAPKVYDMYYEAITARAWQIYADSDIAKLLVNAYVEWVIGPGLNLQAQPIETIITSEGYSLNTEDFVKHAEARFRTHAKSSNSSHSRQGSMHTVGRDVLKNAIIGGDCLAVWRTNKNNNVTVEAIDGRHIKTPTDQDLLIRIDKRGNTIIHGIERNKAKEHVAYYVDEDNGKYKRYEARGKSSGRLQAAMIYGDKYRIDDVRGIPLFASSIEKLVKIDRYIEAVVSGTEERAKMAYYSVSNHFSDGSDPLTDGVANGYSVQDGEERVAPTIDEAQREVFKTTNKLFAIMPVGTDLKTLESTIELKAGPFIKDMLLYVAASMGIPYEVAVMMYENSFSASRMASQTWMQIIKNTRKLFNPVFYQPAYNIQLEMDILNGKVKADGYLQAILDDNELLVLAYQEAQFTGHGVPQADPTKEVKAVVLMLQNNLISHDQAAELLAGGDFLATIKRLGIEYEKIMEYIPEEYQRPPNAETDSAELGTEPKAPNPTK